MVIADVTTFVDIITRQKLDMVSLLAFKDSFICKKSKVNWFKVPFLYIQLVLTAYVCVCVWVGMCVCVCVCVGGYVSESCPRRKLFPVNPSFSNCITFKLFLQTACYPPGYPPWLPPLATLPSNAPLSLSLFFIPPTSYHLKPTPSFARIQE